MDVVLDARVSRVAADDNQRRFRFPTFFGFSLLGLEERY
jgi:hypothetical protein